ncbi:unnamed protein product [Rhodiola kirilowii]
MADQRVLEINVAYAQGLKDVNLFTKMDVYVTVSIVGGNNNSNIKQKTNVDRDSGTHPTWNFPMRFTVDALQGRRSSLVFKLKCEGSLADTDIGEVCVPIKDLLNSSSVSCESKSSKFVHYQVTTPSGKGQGTLTFSYKFLEKVFGAQSVEPVERAAESTQQPTTYLPPQQPMEPSLSHCGFSCQDTLYRPNTYPQTPVPIYSYPADALPEQVLGSGYVYPPAPNSYPPPPDPTTGFVYIYSPPQSAAPNYAYVPYQQQPLQQLVCPPTSSGGQSVYPYPPQADHKYGCPPQAYPGYW